MNIFLPEGDLSLVVVVLYVELNIASVTMIDQKEYVIRLIRIFPQLDLVTKPSHKHQE